MKFFLFPRQEDTLIKEDTGDKLQYPIILNYHMAIGYCIFRLLIGYWILVYCLFNCFFLYFTMKKMNLKPNIKYIAFDADDTLWDNEPFYRALEHVFNDAMLPYMSAEESSAELYKTEIANLALFGYGAKAYTLSILETALRLSKDKLPVSSIRKILEAGKKLTDSPLVLLDNVEDVLKILAKKYKLILATKGDLLDQERKLRKSRLEKYFHHIEIMSDKQVIDYQKLLAHLDIEAGEFLMIGNSMRSDIVPVLELGAYAIHIPYHTTWAHEKMEGVELSKDRFMEIETLLKIPEECPWI